MTTSAASDEGAAPVPATPVVYLTCLAQWLLPGAGYALLGRRGRGLLCLVAISFMVAWGLHLGGEMSRPEPPQILSYLKTFACLGLGALYPIVTRSPALGNGRGDITAGSNEYGNTFLLAAGLIAYLLVLDVYDIAVRRKD